jgi:zinc finger FYVE domain-containing protein 1
MSQEQSSCTMGVNCYYQKFFYNHEILCIDTEGLQGVTQNENQQHRMLMKVLAISDIIIYRTRAERLSIEMYKFLATASKTYLKHFRSLLHVDTSPASTSTAKGPHVIIFHETHNTRPLTNNLNDEPERVIKEKFAELSLSIEAFNSLHYVGIKTNHPPTDYNPLKSILRKKIESIDEEKTRPIRTFRSIYESLVLLNERFSGDIRRTDYTFHELHFTCEMICEACMQRCENTKDHNKEGIEHKNDSAW